MLEICFFVMYFLSLAQLCVIVCYINRYIISEFDFNDARLYYIFFYNHLNIQPNSVRVRFLNGKCFVLSSVRFEPAPVVHCYTNSFCILPNHLTPRSNSLSNSKTKNKIDNTVRIFSKSIPLTHKCMTAPFLA